jgi:hypothetical protein
VIRRTNEPALDENYYYYYYAWDDPYAIHSLRLDRYTREPICYFTGCSSNHLYWTYNEMTSRDCIVKMIQYEIQGEHVTSIMRSENYRSFDISTLANWALERNWHIWCSFVQLSEREKEFILSYQLWLNTANSNTTRRQTAWTNQLIIQTGTLFGCPREIITNILMEYLLLSPAHVFRFIPHAMPNKNSSPTNTRIRGTYNNTQTYEQNDIVTIGHQTFRANGTLSNHSVHPSFDMSWNLIL